MKTAIEWLEDIIYGTDDFVLHEVIKQAKEMEKAQIKNAYNSGWGVITDTATDYYKKTYESKR